MHNPFYLFGWGCKLHTEHFDMKGECSLGLAFTFLCQGKTSMVAIPS
jgi:hypothetical protein